MFKQNPAGKQFSFIEPYFHYPQYVRDVLHNSWAEYFFTSIFSKIDENRYAVLYSEKYSRPNAPVNLIVIEARDNDKGLSMIVHTERQLNIVSDSELGINAIDSDLKGVETIVSDGAFYPTEIVKKAEEKGISLSFSALNGRCAPEGKLGADQFVIEPETELIIGCPGGFVPVSTCHVREKGIFQAAFNKENCAICSLMGSFIIKEQKKLNKLIITEKKLIADRYRRLLGTSEHQVLADFRAGVEGVPSVLRRVYSIDNLPVRGLMKLRIWDQLKMMAFNFKSFYSYFRKSKLKNFATLYFSRILLCCYGFGRILAFQE